MPKKELSDVEMHVLEKNGQAKSVMTDEEMAAAEGQEKPGLMDRIEQSNQAGLDRIANIGIPTSREGLDMAMSMGSGAAFGSPFSAGVESVMGGAADKLRNIANSQAVKAFNPAAKDVQSLIESGAGRSALDAGMGALDSNATLYNKLSKKIGDIGAKEIAPELERSGAKVNVDELAKGIEKPRGVETLEQTADRMKAAEELKHLGNQTADKALSAKDTYGLKQSYDAQAGYKSTGGVSNATDKMLADTMREQLGQIAPGVQGPLKQQQNLIRLKNEIGGSSASPSSLPKTAKTAVVKAIGSKGNQIAATTADGMAKVLASPKAQALGKFLPTLLGAQQRGPAAFQASIHVLNQDPEFRETISSLAPAETHEDSALLEQ